MQSNPLLTLGFCSEMDKTKDNLVAQAKELVCSRGLCCKPGSF